MNTKRPLPAVGEDAPPFSPFDDRFRDDPLPFVAEAHRRAPVFFEPNLGAWALTRYHDVAEALRDSATFASTGINGLVSTPIELASRLPDLGSAAFTTVMATDPPHHGVLRMPMQRAVSRRLVDTVGPTARAVADELIDGFIDDRECDLMTDFAYPFAGRVIARLLGLPEDRIGDYDAWFEHFGSLFVARPLDGAGEAGRLGHDFTPEQVHAMWSGMIPANDFFRHWVLDHREHPREDMISAMLDARHEDGAPVYDDGDCVRAVFTLLGAGQDTTANLIGNIATLLSAAADQQALLVGDMGLLGNAVEEGCRRKGAAAALIRRTTRALKIADAVIPAGSLIYLSLHGANLDPERFEDPGRFDIRRSDASRHLAFGTGRHACPGQPLARLEAEVALGAIYHRIPGLAVDLDRPRAYKPNITVNTMQGLRATW